MEAVEKMRGEEKRHLAFHLHSPEIEMLGQNVSDSHENGDDGYQNDKDRWDPTTLLVTGRGSVGREEEKQKGKVCFLMLQSHN